MSQNLNYHSISRRILVFSFIFWILYLSVPGIATDADAGEATVLIDNERISADISDVPLCLIIQEIEKQSGIQFQGNMADMNRSISVQFEDLPLEKGISRILATMNYSLVFNSKNEIDGVIVLGSEGTKAPGERRSRGTDSSDSLSPKRAYSTVQGNSNTEYSHVYSESRQPKQPRSGSALFRPMPGPPDNPTGESLQGTSDEGFFNVVENAPAPGGVLPSHQGLPPLPRTATALPGSVDE